MAVETSEAQLRSLSREVAVLTANLQRERQRRKAAAELLKEREVAASEMERLVRQVQYANKKLEQELRELKETKIDHKPYDDESETKTLQNDVKALRQEMEKIQLLHQSTRPADDSPSPCLAEAAADHPHQFDIDGAVQEMHAIIPQYKAAISGLQSRLAVLNKQLEATTQQRDALQTDATAWQQKAQSLEASYVSTAAKLHAQEAIALQSASAAQMKIEGLETAVATWKARCQEAEASLHNARSMALKSQKHAENQARLIATQAQTIDRLEETVREQQDDILSALSLVCNRSPPLPKKINRAFEEESLLYQSWDGKKSELKTDRNWKIPAVSKSPMKEAKIVSMPDDGGLNMLEACTRHHPRHAETEICQEKEKPLIPAKRVHGRGSTVDVASEIASLHAALRQVI